MEVGGKEGMRDCVEGARVIYAIELNSKSAPKQRLLG